MNELRAVNQMLTRLIDLAFPAPGPAADRNECARLPQAARPQAGARLTSANMSSSHEGECRHEIDRDWGC
jgi:hypothetical protein